MCLFEKGVTFESRLLDLQRFEQHAPEYLAINPNGVVPSLVVDDRPVIKSSIIIEFIDDTFPDPPTATQGYVRPSGYALVDEISDDYASRPFMCRRGNI